MRSTAWVRCVGFLAGCTMLALSANLSHAGVKPGDFITADNAEKVKDLVSPGVYYKVQHGMSLKVVPRRLAAPI